MTKQWCAPSAWLVLAIISIVGMSEAQTHIFPAQDTNNVFTGSEQIQRWSRRSVQRHHHLAA
jgi:hypothetical protein